MGKLQYINSPEKNFSLGIDARSAENQIREGFVKDLLNADIVEERPRKRRGYQGYAGNLPFRVTKMEYKDSTNEVCFTLDSAVSLDSTVSLETVRSSPIVVYGRSSEFTSGQGPFTDTDSVHYYDAFMVPLRKELAAPSGTLVITQDEHGLTTTNAFISVLESTSLNNRSYTRVLTDSISMDESSFDVDVGYTTYIDRNAFVVFADKDTVTGSSYVHTQLAVGTGVQSFTIPAATHALSNFNIIAQVQQDTGSDRLQVDMDSFEIAINGDVTVALTNGTGAAQDYYVLLSAAPSANIATGSVAGGSSGTITLVNVESPWIFYAIYLEQVPGGTKELVYADSIDYDDTTGNVTLSFTNMSGSARNFFVYFEYGNLRSNQLCVTDTSVTVNGTDEAPQISIWGLDHDDVYQNKASREGWATHIDSYRRSGERRLICGLGGNLFSAREYSEAATQYAYPLLYPNLAARTSSAQVLAPLFWDTGELPGRTRGYITSSNTALHFATVSAIEYDSSNGWSKVTIELPSKTIVDSTGTPTSLSSVISTTANLEDYITLQGMSYARHNGVFKIKQVQDDTDQIFLWVEIDTNTSDYDDSGTAGEGAVFTDQFTWTSSAPFIPDDVLLSDSLPDTVIATVVSSVGTVTVCGTVVDRVDVAAGVLFNGERTSSVIPLREAYPASTASVENIVRGDMLSYSDIIRQVRVLYVNSDQDRNLDVAVSNGIATCTLISGDTSYLSIGQKVLLRQAGVYSGAQTITDITGPDTFDFETSETDSVMGATLVGNCIQIDEELAWSDSPGDIKSFCCETRWIPIESPDTDFDLVPLTHVRYFDANSYSSQEFIRSTMVVDTLFATNGSDEVYKFDGTNNYRAGVIPWQPGAFLTQNTAATARIVTSLRSLSYSAKTSAEGKLTITAANTNVLPIGSSVRLSGSTQTYTIASYTNDGSNYYVLMDRALDAGVSATGTVSEIGIWRYYYRLSAVDANNNIVASAVTGYQDHVMELTADAAIQHKLVGLPAWDVLDYDRLECEIFRTKKNQAAPFYKITTQAMSFNNTEGYILYNDSFADSDLNELDKVSTALKGAELGVSWSGPVRARYITSIGNRLVLGHVKDYPQLDLQIVAPAATTNADFAGDTLLFRRDNTDTGTATNMVDRIKYEWINGVTGTASAHSIGSGQFSFTTSSATGAVAGDWIYLTYDTVATSGRDLTYSGWWQIATVVGTTVTVKLSGAAAATSYPNRYVIATDPTDVPVLLGTDGNLGMVNGDSFDIFDAMRRMSIAINASQRMVDVTISGMELWKPWLVVRSGNDVGQAGRLLVRQPRADSTTMEVVPTFSGYDLFCNSIKRASGDQVSAATRVYPSRILASYENYPEIIDNSNVVLDTDSDSAIDVNSADGQEITGIIPFFGETAFTSAQQAAILVVFKTNSIYLVDINQKVLGNQAVQRIETEGLGCTAPYSIAVTKRGIMFANESGMYCLRRDQSIQYVGKFMERNWTERVDLDTLSIAHGTHYGIGRAYKLSVPFAANVTSTDYLEPSEVFVYNHTNEDEGKLGAWCRYDNHPSIGWANLADDAFFASTSGRVFILRNTGLEQDFRDDSSPINMVLETRPNDFGNSGIRKVIDAIIVHYRIGADSVGTQLGYSIDLEEEYSTATPAILRRNSTVDGTSDTVKHRIIPIVHSTSRRRGVYFSVQLSNNTIDESIEIAGIDYKVGGLSEKGILQAAQTS